MMTKKVSFFYSVEKKKYYFYFYLFCFKIFCLFHLKNSFNNDVCVSFTIYVIYIIHHFQLHYIHSPFTYTAQIHSKFVFLHLQPLRNIFHCVSLLILCSFRKTFTQPRSNGKRRQQRCWNQRNHLVLTYRHYNKPKTIRKSLRSP